MNNQGWFSLGLTSLISLLWNLNCLKKKNTGTDDYMKNTMVDLSGKQILIPKVETASVEQPYIRVFSSESALRIRWPQYWSFSFSISLFSAYSGLISCRIDLISLLSKGLSSLLQQHSLKASILQPSAFFMVHLYMITGKTTALTIWQMLPRNVVVMD